MTHGDRTIHGGKAEFCRFHKGLIAVGIAENTCDHCLLKKLSAAGLSISDPKNVTLYPHGNLGMLISRIGTERWSAIRDDPREIRDMLIRTNFFAEVGAELQFPWVEPEEEALTITI